MSGYVKAYRARFRHHLFEGERFCRGWAWDWMIAQARYEDGRESVGGRTIELRRGQFVASVRGMADTFGWGVATVDRFLTRLRGEGMIGTDTGTGKLVITICNYDHYQASNGRGGTLGGTPEDDDTPPEHQRNATRNTSGTLSGTQSGTAERRATNGNGKDIRDGSAQPGTLRGTPEIADPEHPLRENRNAYKEKKEEGKKEERESLLATAVSTPRSCAHERAPAPAAPPQQREGSGSSFLDRLMANAGVDPDRPGGYWMPNFVWPVVGRWRTELALTDDEILNVVTMARRSHRDVPNGPKAFDVHMHAYASAKAAGRPDEFSLPERRLTYGEKLQRQKDAFVRGFVGG